MPVRRQRAGLGWRQSAPHGRIDQPISTGGFMGAVEVAQKPAQGRKEVTLGNRASERLVQTAEDCPLMACRRECRIDLQCAVQEAYGLRTTNLPPDG